MIITHASVRDCEQISEIHNSHILSCAMRPEAGFFHTPSTKETFQEFVNLPGFLVAKECEGIIGYLLAIQKNHTKKGVATTLYNHLFTILPQASFSAYISEKPFLNKASIAFHQKLHFQRVGTWEAKEFIGIKNYESGFWVRA